jgi:protein ImuB
MKRVTCVWFPNWPVQRVRLAQWERKQQTTSPPFSHNTSGVRARRPPQKTLQPLALFAESGPGGLRIVTCCQQAMNSGIKPGMPLAEARSLLPAAEFLQHDPAADLTALHELCWWSHRYSPLVGLDARSASPKKRASDPQPESLLLDTTGCDHLFGGEQQMVRCIVHDLRERGLVARVAVADTIGAAWAAAHCARGQMMIIPARVVDELASLPVEALRLPAKIVDTLHELDVRRIEQLLALPRESLPSRFGRELVQRLDQALGLADELIVHERPPEPVEATQSFEVPLTDQTAVLVVLGELISQLTVRLQEQSLGAQRVQCMIQGDREPVRFSVGFVRPSASAERMRELVELQLEQQALPAEVSGVRLHAEELRPLGARQRLFFDDEGDAAELALLLERLAGRLGEDATLRPQLQAEHQPELAVRWSSVLADQSGATALAEPNSVPKTRPLFLRPRPAPVQAVSVFPEGPPIRFRWEGGEYVVARCRGPERIETGWWRERHVRRDYYLVETDDGRWFWLFRERKSGAWFLHGEF